MAEPASKTPKRRLNELLKTSITVDNLPAIFAEMGRDGPRGAGILAACLLDDALRGLLLSKMQPLSSANYDAIFGSMKPLSSLSAKIDIGHALGLFDAASKSDMHAVRTIRNALAHGRTVITFETPEIAELCTNLKSFVYPRGSDPRSIYMLNVLEISRMLLIKQANLLDERRSKLEERAKSSADQHRNIAA